jgi:hypothetical protein
MDEENEIYDLLEIMKTVNEKFKLLDSDIKNKDNFVIYVPPNSKLKLHIGESNKIITEIPFTFTIDKASFNPSEHDKGIYELFTHTESIAIRIINRSVYLDGFEELELKDSRKIYIR